MAQPSSVTNILTGVGASIATQVINTTGYQAVVLVDSSGNFLNDGIIESFYACSPRISGNATAAQFLYSMTSNWPGKINLKSVNIYSDYTAALATPTSVAQLRRMSAISGGIQQPAPTPLDTAGTQPTGFIFRAPIPNDYGPAGALQVPISGLVSGILGQVNVGRLHTAVGETSFRPSVIWPPVGYNQPIVLNNNETVVVLISGNATTANPTSNSYYTSMVFDMI